ncbi:MAG: hypothetical protein Q9224_003787 [Gallowayella concinna]
MSSSPTDLFSDTYTLPLPPKRLVRGDAGELSRDTLEKVNAYATYQLASRNITPRTACFLQLYRDKAQTCIREPSNRDHKVAMLQLNDILHSEAFLAKDPDWKSKDHSDAILQIRQFQYFAFYGDYVGEACLHLRQQASSSARLPEAGMFCDGKTWQMVQTELAQEKHQWDTWTKSGRQGAKPPVPLTDAICAATSRLKIDWRNIFDAIEWYAERNKAMHDSVLWYIKNCEWETLAVQLARDLREVPTIFGSEDRDKMVKVIEEIRDRFFEALLPQNSPTTLEARARTAKKNAKQEKADEAKMQAEKRANN